MGAKLSFAPVFYTLVQFKFNPITQMPEYVPRIQEHLRRIGYPDFRQDTLVSFNIRRTDEAQPEIQNLQQNRWSFTNAKGDEGYLVSSDSLVFHTVAYDSFDNFSDKALTGLSFMHKTIELAYIDRIGLRYLDFVSPKAGELIDDYLTPSLLGHSMLISGTLTHAYTETLSQIDGGTLIARAVITESGLTIPPDLVPLNLKLSPRFSSVSGRNAVLDVDYFVSERLDGVNMDLIRSQLHASHKIITDAFLASVTDHAIKSWE